MYKAIVKIIVAESKYYNIPYKIIEKHEIIGKTVEEIMGQIYDNWDIHHADNKDIEIIKF